MVERISQKLLESETRQKSREVKDTQTLRMWCVEQAIRVHTDLRPLSEYGAGVKADEEDPISLARRIENYILGRVVSS